MDMPYADVDRVAKLIPADARHDARQGARENPDAAGSWQQKDERVTRSCWPSPAALEGLTRHASMHAAGVVIAPKAAHRFRARSTRRRRTKSRRSATMKAVERIGLLKMDFLGLSTLTVIRDAHRRDQADGRASISTSTRSRSTTRRPTSCFSDGQTFGVFQFEISRHARLLRKAKPRPPRRPHRAQRALPPGAAQERHGRRLRRAQAGHAPRSSTSCRELGADSRRDLRRHRLPGTGDAHRARCWPASRWRQADMLRKAMGKKDPKVMAKQREAFCHGAKANGVNEKKATKIFDLMEFFAGYGFNKSHSTAYALIAYQTAYLKANYPAHFMAALLTIEAANTDKLAMYLGRVPRPWRHHSAAGPELERTGLHRGRRRRPLRAVRRQERRGGGHPVPAERPQGARTHRLALRPVRARRLAAGQQKSARKPGQGRRDGLAVARNRRKRCLAPGSPSCGRRQGHRERRPSPARSRQGTVAALWRRRRRFLGSRRAARRASLDGGPAARG